MRYKVGITLRLNYSTNRLHNASHDYSVMTENYVVQFFTVKTTRRMRYFLTHTRNHKHYRAKLITRAQLATCKHYNTCAGSLIIYFHRAIITVIVNNRHLQ